MQSITRCKRTKSVALLESNSKMSREHSKENASPQNSEMTSTPAAVQFAKTVFGAQHFEFLAIGSMLLAVKLWTRRVTRVFARVTALPRFGAF